MDEQERLGRLEERVTALEHEATQAWTAHDRVHELEERARTLALAALQSQTRLILAIIVIVVTVAGLLTRVKN